MFKQIVTIFRGQAYEASERVVDQHALTLLRQQIRDCVQAVGSARRAVALAIAQNEQEVSQCERIKQRITDLEERTLAAMAKGNDALAHEAADTIAHLEAERDASLAAQATFTTEISRLKHVLRASEARLKDVERGQRIAAAVEKTHTLREAGTGSALNALRDAEETLGRLKLRQRQMDIASEALAEMEATGNPSIMAEKLAAAGCGAPLKNTAEDVLKRLQQKLQPKP